MEYLKKGFYQVATLLMFLVVFGLIGGFDTVTYGCLYFACSCFLLFGC